MPIVNTVVWSDTFTGTAGTNVHGYNGWEGDYSPDVTLDGAGNVQTQISSFHAIVQTTSHPGQDYGVRMTYTPNGASPYTMVNMRRGALGGGDGVHAYVGGTTLFLNDSSGTLDTASGLDVSGTWTLMVECIGTTAKAYFNDVEMCSATTSDSGNYFGLTLSDDVGNTAKWSLIEVLEVGSATPKYTELEWSVGLQSPAADTDVYEFRVYYDGLATPLNTYAVTPQLTAVAGGGGVNATATPAVIARVVTVPAVTTSAGTGATTSPAVIARAVTVPAVTPQAGSTTVPAVIARAVTVPAPTTSTGTGATTAPAVIARAATVPAVTAQAGSTVTPTVIARSVVIDQAVASTTAAGTAAPAVIARSVTVLAPTTQAGSSTSPVVIARSVVIAQATPQASKTTAPVVIARSVVIGQATPSTATNATAAPAAIARAVTILAVTTQAGSSGTPAVIALSMTLPAPFAGTITPATATPATITLTLVMPAPHAVGAGVYALYVGAAPVTAAYLGATLIDGNNIHLNDAVGLFAAATATTVEELAAALLVMTGLYYGPDPVEAVYVGDALVGNVHVGAP